jgi:NADP-dependent 3-hydroxy acid dehydrogenase YdfG
LAAATVSPGLGATVAIGDIDESAVEDQLGPIDVVVNNAGVIAVGSAVDEDDAVTRRVLNVNIYGVILWHQAVRTTDVAPR